MQDRFKYKVKLEIDGEIEIFDVTNLHIEDGQIFFKREDGQYYNIGIGCQDVELLQCTGLKDKNGKLIYEGDIVYIDYEEDYAAIEWRNDLARFIINLKNQKTITDFDNYYGKELEVVGNIYENPELLSEVE